MPDTAIAFAKELDIELAEGKHRGMFHGIPVSIKDLTVCSNTVTTCGMSTYLDRMAFEDGSVVKTIAQNGGVVFCKTNLP